MSTETVSKTFAYFTIAFCTVAFAACVTIVAGAAVPTDFPINGTEEALLYLKNIRPKKVILDVDAGVDDAVAILLALVKNNPDYPEIIAITCTHGNAKVKNVVINVLRTLQVLNLSKKIPVYMGAYSSLTTTPEGDSFYGKDGFGDVADPNPPSLEDAENEHAVNAMVRLVQENPGEVAVVAVGPLTNVALAIRMDPEFRSNLKALYWMGGSTEGIGNIKPGIEFNAFMDPEANFIIFNTTGPPVIMLSWEACVYHGAVPKEWRINVLAKVNSTYVTFLNAIEALTLSKSKRWAVCDAKLMAVLLDVTIVTQANMLHIDPIYQGDARGALMVDYKDQIRPRNAVLIQAIDAEKFENMCLENLA